PQRGTLSRPLAPPLHWVNANGRRARPGFTHQYSDHRMTHGRRGLTVLSLLIILIVVALIVFILLRASNRAGDAPPLGDDPSAIPAESVESATLTSIRAPQSNVSPGDSDTLTVRLTN